MGRIICNLATSVDRFIADAKGGVDWLNDFPPTGNDYGMPQFFEQCGNAIMGSKTYEQALSFNSWFEGMQGVVFTSRDLPAFKDKPIRFVKGNPAPVVEELRRNKKDSWLVGGGKLITSFINHRLIDELIITIVPRLLGDGMPLCPGLDQIDKLQLRDSKIYEDGAVQLKYQFG